MSRKGFTLIELLVVVAVLALLASIVFSNLGGAREGARISNALSFQSQTHSLLGSDLVGWWNFNEGSGTTARDISGYDNHGTIIGATYVDGVPGTGGTALEFDGVGDYVDAGNTSNLKGFNVLSISAWVKRETTEGNSFIVGKEGIYKIDVNSTDKVRFLTGENWSGSVLISNSALIPNQWYHIVATYDGSIKRIYINGQQDNDRETSGEVGTNNNIVGIGGRPADKWKGLIDDVRIYSRALTASEIQTLYAKTKDNYLAND